MSQRQQYEDNMRILDELLKGRAATAAPAPAATVTLKRMPTRAELQKLRSLCHPDKWQGNPAMNEIMAMINAFFD